MAEQTHEKRLRDLVDRWEELRAQGVEPSEVELCKDAPELLGELQAWIRAMKATDWLSKPVASHTLSLAGRPEDTLAPRPAQSRSVESAEAKLAAATGAPRSKRVRRVADRQRIDDGRRSAKRDSGHEPAGR